MKKVKFALLGLLLAVAVAFAFAPGLRQTAWAQVQTLVTRVGNFNRTGQLDIWDGTGNKASHVSGSLAADVTITGLTINSPVAGVGYSTGAGGTVTQATSKSTGVTLSTNCGAITMHNAALAAGTIVSFTLTNTSIAATDVLVLNHISGGTVGSYTLNAQCAAGSATINVRNNTAGSLGEAIVIQFAVIKGVNS